MAPGAVYIVFGPDVGVNRLGAHRYLLITREEAAGRRSQSVTASKRNASFLPLAFAEQSNTLRALNVAMQTRRLPNILETVLPFKVRLSTIVVSKHR